MEVSTEREMEGRGKTKTERACAHREKGNAERGRGKLKCLDYIGRSFWGREAQPQGWKI